MTAASTIKHALKSTNGYIYRTKKMIDRCFLMAWPRILYKSQLQICQPITFDMTYWKSWIFTSYPIDFCSGEMYCRCHTQNSNILRVHNKQMSLSHTKLFAGTPNLWWKCIENVLWASLNCSIITWVKSG